MMKIFAFTLLLAQFSASTVFTMPPNDEHLKVDQFGYRPGDRKIAVISNPVSGYNSGTPFVPGSNYQVVNWTSGMVVFSGSPVMWNGGNTHSQSGDKVWWFDFSSLTAPGAYYVYDLSNNVRSHRFEIAENIRFGTLKQALKVFYYQRCGTAKSVPYAQFGWTDAACHLHALQDTDCRLYNNSSPATSKNLSGGWHDAGDYNKYVNFTFEPMLDLLLAYSENPLIWGDDSGLPESGNGIPDILDEVKHELEWLRKMQNSNGSFLSIVGVQNFASASPPSADLAQRFYGPATTSATFTAAAIFALSAIQFQNIGQSSYASALRTAAESAWAWASANQNITFNNSGLIGAGEQEVSAYERLVRRMAASCFLFALTGNSAYNTFFESNYNQMHLIQWGFVYPFENGQQDMLLYYAHLPGTSSTVSSAIKSAYRNSVKSNNADNLPAYLNKTDAYRAYLSNQNYTWGSNTTKARQGNIFMNMITYRLDTLSNTDYREAAQGFVNYFHGVNPTSFCFLSNMSGLGAENSIREIYHAWFEDGSSLWDRAGVSVYGPAPGYVSGGVNPAYTLDGCCPSGCGASNSLCNTTLVTPPLNQPIQKSYKDWNTAWPQNSWTITEPGIYTQAAYVKLVSKFVAPSSLKFIRISFEGMYTEPAGNHSLKDTLILYLRSSAPAYQKIDSAMTVADSLTFRAYFSFSNAAAGTYYLSVKHRNCIETWSRPGGEAYHPSAQFAYDFTSDSAMAYGSNLKRVDTSPQVFAMYSGDVNSDGVVDISDLLQIDNEAASFGTGYINTDLTGDLLADLSDLVIADNNASLFVSIVTP